MSRRTYRRPARWAAFDVDGTHRVAVGAAGFPPSRQARQLAAAPHLSLPPALWHIPEYNAATLATITPVVTNATHRETGARFLLASVPNGPVLAIAALDDLARGLVGAFWHDPAAWAAEQAWHIEGDAA